MAFGFISDVVESIGDVLLGEKGSGQRTGRVAEIGATLAGASPEVAAFAGKVGEQYAGGGSGQAATSTPTINQRPIYAPESAMSGGDNGMVYRPQVRPKTAGFTPRLPSPTVRDIGAGVGGGAIMDIIPDINISKYFGSDPCMKKMPALVGLTRDGCPTVTRKQQRVLRQMAQYMPLESVAYEAGVDTTTMARLISKTFPPRSKGISGAQLRTANRVNNKILSMAGKLGYNVTPKTKAQLGCK
jgi:hypothetical protein